MSEKIDDLFVSLSADLGPLDSSLSAAVGKVQSAGEAMAGAFNGASGSIDPVGASLNKLGESAVAAGEGAKQAAQGYLDLRPAIQGAGQAAQNSIDPMEAMLGALQKAALQFLAFNTIVTEVRSSLDEFGKIQRVTEALDATTGNIEGVAAAMREIPALADKIGVSIQSVNDGFVKFARYGLDLNVIPGILTAIQSGAIADGKTFDTVATAWERAVNTGVIMSRTIQSMGTNMRELAASMGMVGRTDAEVSAAFKGISDSIDGTNAATQRAKILMASIPDSVKGLAASVDDVGKSFQQMSNAVTEAKIHLGEALTEMGQAGGLEALQVVIKGIETVLLGVITVVGELVTSIVGFSKIAIDALTGVGNVINDLVSGNFKKAIADGHAAGEKIAADWNAWGQKMGSEFVSTGKILNDIWGETTAGISDKTGVMADKIAQSTGMASAATIKAVEKMNTETASGIGAMVSNFQQLGTVANQALTNAVNAFDKAAAAFASGVGSATEYAKALKALDTAQKDISGGFENLKTSMLVVGNAYRDMNVNAANAATTLKAVVNGMANGMANATQYSAALKALNKAQEDLSGGLQNYHTAMLLVVDDHSKLQVALKNAETQLRAVYAEYLNNKASLGQLEAAISAVDKAQRALNDGLSSYSTMLAKASADYQNIQIAAQNAETWLRAVQADYDKGLATLPQLTAAVDAYVKAQMAASGGAESWASAELKLLDQQAKLEVSFQNANTELAKATGLYNAGAIGFGVYERAVQAAKSAHDALLGVHQQQAAAVSQLTSALQAYNQAQNNANNAAQNGLTIGYNLKTEQLNLQNALRDSNSQLEEATRLFNSGAIGSAVLQKAIQATDSALKNLGTTTAGMSSDMTAAVDALRAAAAAIGQVGEAATAAASAVQSLGQQLDASMNATPGNLSASSTPGSTWDYGNAMHSAQFGALVEMGGPAALGNISNWSTSGTAGSPQELADLAAKNLAAMVATQQSLMKSYQDLTHSSTATGAAITSLGAAAAASAVNMAGLTNSQQTAIDAAATQVDIVTAAYQANKATIDDLNKAWATYEAAIAAALPAVNTVASTLSLASDTASTAVVALGIASTNAADSITQAGKSIDQGAMAAVAAVSAVSNAIMSQISGGAIGSQVASAPGVLADVPGSRGGGAVSSLVSNSVAGSTPSLGSGNFEKFSVTINATPSVADIGHQLMDFLRLQGVTA